MTPLQHEIDRILNHQDGLLSRRRHPELGGAVDALLAEQRLVRLLPGVYATPAAAEQPLTRVRATQLWDPDAVLTPRGRRLSDLLAEGSADPGAPRRQAPGGPSTGLLGKTPHLVLAVIREALAG